ncbi:sodium/nucleoside cotransporter 1-like [Dermacentor silvarum]|uniref:sodium/nucleoside cotransporter 1-like n=1 Tax=Dermacentor silvarum TaxID=543639 RepID=UPI00189965C4|nr:sodium/nucleoside cotransporter 1-like [Dermacentor silvarum]
MWRCPFSRSFSKNVDAWYRAQDGDRLFAESTLMVHPYMAIMTPSEVFTVITCGFATLSASTLPELVDAGIDLNDVVTSGILGSLGSLCLSKVYLPEVDKVKVKRGHFSINKSRQLWFADVLGSGLMVSLTLAGCMTGCLVAFVTFFAFADGIVNWMGEAAGLQGLRADEVVAGLFRPFACVFGLPWEHTEVVARVIALKAMLHETVAAAYLMNQTSRVGVRQLRSLGTESEHSDL